MQNMKKKSCDNNNTSTNGVVKQKERHIVSWSQEEDAILREQIGTHGTDNWAIVASKFKDKTTRQCRRRWFTYLNSDFKKGGWSQEEDMLLCEAQKIFGNRWTEIAKVVSGRTRFQTGQDADRFLETVMPPSKMRRKHIPDTIEDCNVEEVTGTFRTIDQQLRPPFAVLMHNCHNVNNLTAHLHPKIEEGSKDGTFLKKDDPKIIALLQQAELLSSLALKVNTEKTAESYENACKFENIKDLVEDVRSCNEGSQQSWRKYFEANLSISGNDDNQTATITVRVIRSHSYGFCEVEHQTNQVMQPNSNVDGKNIPIPDSTTNQVLVIVFDNDVEALCPLPNSEFNSPLQVTPLFRSLGAGIPSPQFSESVVFDIELWVWAYGNEGISFIPHISVWLMGKELPTKNTRNGVNTSKARNPNITNPNHAKRLFSIAF
ncbi:transcription factor MYB124-like protein [Tanacetum coccineum]